MSLRSRLIAIASLAAGVAFLTLLVAVSGLRLREVFAQFAVMDRPASFRLAGLVAVNTFLSSLKWQNHLFRCFLQKLKRNVSAERR